MRKLIFLVFLTQKQIISYSDKFMFYTLAWTSLAKCCVVLYLLNLHSKPKVWFCPKVKCPRIWVRAGWWMFTNGRGCTNMWLIQEHKIRACNKRFERIVAGRVQNIVTIDDMYYFGLIWQGNNRCNFHSSSAAGGIPSKKKGLLWIWKRNLTECLRK